MISKQKIITKSSFVCSTS